MTADEDLNQRVQIARDRIVETAPLEARTGERDSVPEPARKKVQQQFRFQQQSNRDCHIDAGCRKQSRQLNKTEKYHGGDMELEICCDPTC